MKKLIGLYQLRFYNWVMRKLPTSFLQGAVIEAWFRTESPNLSMPVSELVTRLDKKD